VEHARDADGRRLLTLLGPLRTRLARYGALLWWLHSAYALALGAGIMWLGARNYSWLRYSGFYLSAIWALSLFLANVVQSRDGAWWGRARLVVNYVNKNLYQQLLFFILPVYAGSTTWPSPNAFFLVLLAASAVLSTLDIVYDRVLSARRGLAALFFAFNVFAVVNVALPVMLGIGSQRSARLATVAAAVGLVSLAWRIRRAGRAPAWAGMAAGAVLAVLAGELGRPLVPPAPLRLMSSAFGSSLDRAAMRIAEPLSALPADARGRVYAVAAVRAPLGLEDRVQLRWYRDAVLVSASAPYALSGGRREGYRLWSSVDLGESAGAKLLRLDVVTAGGQLVGRAELRSAR
jgi:hypothetical protein